MNTFMAIMSQLFWGVTIGALSAAFSALAKGLAAVVGIGGVGWYSLKRRRDRRARIERKD
ncbi:MAG: hypothetical protein K0R64_409 [Novosphingobium lindaniclasticum]|jgi:hypothetical protein|uniref:Uncharacterized protein n=2 Tax=Novosphingobium TaxID=165696 RepID=T0HZN5_9SPHN|nr:hypothetical protein [Novosphingobium lindaniclasticum]EQB17528.1 hypothetical protein L284_08170 [Novosphingobium lindaniclasticum LE124]MDF2637425.1 hypothetical protein [Novosphingobium lindaniclasticum]